MRPLDAPMDADEEVVRRCGEAGAGRRPVVLFRMHKDGSGGRRNRRRRRRPAIADLMDTEGAVYVRELNLLGVRCDGVGIGKDT
jgi:hypothetical protein